MRRVRDSSNREQGPNISVVLSVTYVQEVRASENQKRISFSALRVEVMSLIMVSPFINRLRRVKRKRSPSILYHIPLGYNRRRCQILIKNSRSWLRE